MFEQATCFPAFMCMSGLELMLSLVLMLLFFAPVACLCGIAHTLMWAQRDREDAARRSAPPEPN